MNAAIVDRLLAMRNEDGGWGTTAGRPSATEPTALAVMALRVVDGDAGLIGGGLEWLIRTQDTSGSWPVMESVPGPSWTASLAVLALQDAAPSSEPARRGLDWLIGEKGIGVPLWIRAREFFNGTKVTALDPTLRGWPWATGTFSWIEPSAYAIIALRRAWPENAPSAVSDRLVEARRMIIDRACPGGGWNYGNKKVLGVDMDPYPDSTALALLALGALEHNAREVEEGFGRLEKMLEITLSGLTLSLSVLSYRQWNRDPANLRTALVEAFERTGFMDEVRSLALATLALSDKPVPLVVT